MTMPLSSLSHSCVIASDTISSQYKNVNITNFVSVVSFEINQTYAIYNLET